MSRAKSESKAKKADPVPTNGVRAVSEDSTNSVAMPTEDAVRIRAYQIYEARGRGEGQMLNDWLTAEAQIIGRQG